MVNIKRTIPYLSLGITSILLFLVSRIIPNQAIKNILINIFSNAIFFFMAYLFYDVIRQLIINNERKDLRNYIRNKVTNDIFFCLYFLKKIIHGYNLDTNTLKNIFNIINYSEKEIASSIRHQNFLGFQIFKDLDEVHSLFKEAASDNFILKYSSHTDTISIIKIANNFVKLESILKDENNFNKCAESAIEYKIMNGKDLDPENDEKHILLKKTVHNDRFVVYDSGYFDKRNIDKLLNTYILKEDVSEKVSKILIEIFSLMKYWIPESTHISKKESRFRIIKGFFTLNTDIKTRNTEIHTGDILESK